MSINSRVLIKDKLHNPDNPLYGIVIRITNEHADLLLDNGQWLLREIKLLEDLQGCKILSS